MVSPALYWRTAQDYNSIHFFILLFLHSGIFSGVVSFGFVHWGFFVLGTRTLCKGGVMIRWLGPLGRCVGTSDIPLLFVCNGRVLGPLEHLIH